MEHCEHTRDESWWEYDRRGIELCRVCDKCIEKRLRSFNPEVLTDEQLQTLGITIEVGEYEDVVEEQIDAEQA